MANLQISDAGYLWIFAVVFVIHLIEEFWGGTRSPDPDKLHGLDLSRGGFIRANLVALGLFMGSIGVALKLGFPQFLLVALATFVVVNGAGHLVTSIRKTEYSSGLVTGVLMFLPLGVFTLVRLEPVMSTLRFSKAIVAGLVMQIGASIIAHRGRQIVRALQARKRAGPSPAATRELLSIEPETIKLERMNQE
jgi:hypothetical protein